jgi:molecular chaperone GrpE (heat shock protein)
MSQADPKPEAVDAVIDPTKNVLDLVAAAITRQDDLRGSTEGLFLALVKGLEKYIDTKIDGHIRLSSERYDGIQREFNNIERRRTEHKNDTEKAVKAAFDAAKEAVKEQAASFEKATAKSESAASDQLKSVEGTVDDLKDRVRTLETQLQTKGEARVDNRSSTMTVVAIIGGIVSALLLAITVAAMMGAAR